MEIGSRKSYVEQMGIGEKGKDKTHTHTRPNTFGEFDCFLRHFFFFPLAESAKHEMKTCVTTRYATAAADGNQRLRPIGLLASSSFPNKVAHLGNRNLFCLFFLDALHCLHPLFFFPLIFIHCVVAVAVVAGLVLPPSIIYCIRGRALSINGHSFFFWLIYLDVLYRPVTFFFFLRCP